MKKMTPARVTLMMLFVMGGLIAAYIAKGLMAVDVKPRADVDRRNVPMPISDLPAGTLITESHLGLGPVFVSMMTRDILLQNKVIVGRVARESLKAAEPIRAGQLYEKGVLPPLEIAQGMRAVSIDLGTTAIVDGLVKPGQYVDVHFSPSALQSDPRLRGGLTMTLFKGVKILAINRLTLQGQVENNNSNSVTLQLSPEQANIILVAKDKGTMVLSFNPNGAGDGHVALKGKDRITLEEILGLEPIKEPEAPPVPFVSQIYRGTSRHEVEFRTNTNRVGEASGGYGPLPDPRNRNRAPVAPLPPGTINPFQGWNRQSSPSRAGTLPSDQPADQEPPPAKQQTRQPRTPPDKSA